MGSRRAAFLGVSVAGLLVAGACSTTSSGNLVYVYVDAGLDASSDSGQVCPPGTTQSCIGPRACQGGQACLDDGSGWTPCDCGQGQGGSAGADAGAYSGAGSGGESGGAEGGAAGETGGFAGGGGEGATPDAGADTGAAGAGPGCPGVVVGAQLTKLNVIFMYDKSDSMGFDPDARWNPVGDGLVAFVCDPASSRMNASLEFFPTDGPLSIACEVTQYESPRVRLSSLEDCQEFVNAITYTSPSGGTPTLPALQGAINYATEAASARPNDQMVVVLVTDGQPGFWVDPPGEFQPGCDNNDIAHLASVAGATFQRTPSIPTYVIAIGPGLDSLDVVASAGGTGEAMMIADTDPAQTTAQFQNALVSIRSQHVPCDLPMPEPPGGRWENPATVNVTINGSSGEPDLLRYSHGCAGGVGWQYDDWLSPAKIELCPDTCNALHADPGAEATVEFGCPTRVN